LESKVSVVIPTYNRAKLIVNAIESVLAQTHPVREIIVVDDGSTDNTAQVLERYLGAQPRLREIVRYFSQPNQGQSVARNKGVKEASGEWIAFLDSDDQWRPEKLELQLSALRKFEGKCQACFTDLQFVNDPHAKSSVFQARGEEKREPMGMVSDSVRLVLDRHQWIKPVWIQTVVTRTDLARRVGGFDPRIRGYGEDDDFIFRLACKTGFCFVNKVLVLVDRSPTCERHAGPSALWDEVEFGLGQSQYRFEKHLRLSQAMAPHVRRLVLRDLRSVHSAWANWYLERGEIAKAREAASIALKYQWSWGVAAKFFLLYATPALARRWVLWKHAEAGQQG
jgi:glycosyltransferase involved in cell wall biosynthesis